MTEDNGGAAFRWRHSLLDQLMLLIVTAVAIGWLPMNEFWWWWLRVIFWFTVVYTAVRLIIDSVDNVFAMLSARKKETGE